MSNELITRFRCLAVQGHFTGARSVQMMPVPHDGQEDHPNRALTDGMPTGTLSFVLAPGKEAQNLFAGGREYEVTIREVKT